MKLNEVLKWAATLPENFLDYEVVVAEIGIIDDDVENNLTYRLDKPVTMLSVDEESNEILFLSKPITLESQPKN